MHNVVLLQRGGWLYEWKKVIYTIIYYIRYYSSFFIYIPNNIMPVCASESNVCEKEQKKGVRDTIRWLLKNPLGARRPPLRAFRAGTYRSAFSSDKFYNKKLDLLLSPFRFIYANSFYGFFALLIMTGSVLLPWEMR